jgi:hypothetical protein
MARQIDLIIARENRTNKLKAANRHTPPTITQHNTPNTQIPSQTTIPILHTNNTQPTAATTRQPKSKPTPAPTNHTTTPETDKELWVYVSDKIAPTGQRGWRRTSDSWQAQLQHELGKDHHCINLQSFTRVKTEPQDPRLILEAPNKVARRELLLAAKKTRRSLKVLLHLSPQSRANKSLLYYKAKRHTLRIDDRGDILILYQQHNQSNNVKIDVQNSAHAVTDKLNAFLDVLAKASQPILKTNTLQYIH